MNPRSFVIALASCLALASSGLRADSQSNTNAGTQAAPFLTWPVDARSASLAQAGVASVSDVNAGVLNPAGLAQVQGEQLSLSQDFLFQGADLSNASVAVGLFRKASVALSVSYFNAGTIDRSTLDANNNIVSAGSFTPYYSAVGLSYGQELLSGLSAGATVKSVGENIAGSTAGTLSGDLGLQYATPLKGIGLGASLQNLGGDLDGYQLPTTLRLGASAKTAFLGYRNSILLNLDGQIPTAFPSTGSMSFGAELRYGRFLSLRAGYQGYFDGNYDGITGIAGVTAGAGFGMNWWQVDYAWVPEGDLGEAYQFSFTAKF